MREKGNNNFTAGFVIVIITLIFIVVAVSSKHQQHKKEFGKIYRGEDGHYYTRGHDRNGFSEWEYFGDSGGGDSSFSNGSWSRVTSTPSGLSATSKVVAEEEGKPTEEVEEESAADSNEEVTESTTESEAEGMDSASDSGSDAGDGGDGGGGDGGGGDGGGGSD